MLKIKKKKKKNNPDISLSTDTNSSILGLSVKTLQKIEDLLWITKDHHWGTHISVPLPEVTHCIQNSSQKSSAKVPFLLCGS